MTDEKKPFAHLMNVEDCTGQKRCFGIRPNRFRGKGYWLEALELREDCQEGYRFGKFSVVSMNDALWRLRRKIERSLARRYTFEDPRSGLNLLAEDMAGHISYRGVIVDGKLIEFGDLTKLLQYYEGRNFELRLLDPYE
jgi:hypothetical protein